MIAHALHRRYGLRLALAVVGGAGLLGLGLLISQVGGMRVRTASQVVLIGELASGQAVLSPGAPTVFVVSAGTSPVPARLWLRLPSGVFGLGVVDAAQVRHGTLVVEVPCGGLLHERGVLQRGRLVLVGVADGAVLAQSGVVTVLPPGPDCYFK